MEQNFTDNFIENQYRELQEYLTEEFINLYDSFSDEKLQLVLSTLHDRLIYYFKLMNDRLPTKDFEAHFWADPSRQLIRVIDCIETVQRKLCNSEYAFDIEPYYNDLIKRCSSFLKKSGGSTIPAHMEKIELYYSIPVFRKRDRIEVKRSAVQLYNLKLLGEGSYANVYVYKDEFYNKNFVLKRAKKDLTDKEIQRFKQEYDEMSRLASPYVVEVYNYDDIRKEYIMEYMDTTLYTYIEKNNSILDMPARKSIGLQILKAFSYIHSKSLLHRDISPNNVLIKKYDDVVVIKVSDFGLVRIPNSDLTSLQTEVKGCFNDPSLQIEGFNNYSLVHEIYALTRLLYFVMTGKTNLNNVKNNKLKCFLEKGTSAIKSSRFQSLEELSKSFKEL